MPPGGARHMLFPTLDFAIFYIVVFVAAWELRHDRDARKLVLVLASYFFYGYWDVRFMALLAGSSLLNYTAGRMIGALDDGAMRKWVLGIAVALNLAVLGFFKYYGFFLTSLAEMLAQVGLERDLPFLEIILPVGISFFTFQGISYLVDVYRRHVNASRSLLDIFLYISFFPQLVAGPIVRAAHFLPQLERDAHVNRRMAALAVVLILVGLFKKMVIANYLATELVDHVFFDPTAFGGGDLLLGVYGYAVQIYCDFSAYSDIAIGVAALLGYRFPRNFDHPYRSSSLQEFWRRWHISLSTWLRDYLYIPLGGSKGSTFATYRNLFITMFLGGIWHGAAWTFVFWGAFHGAMLGVERALKARWTAAFGNGNGYGGGLFGSVLGMGRAVQGSLGTVLGVIVTFHLVCFAWIFFRATNFASAWSYVGGLFDWSEPAQYASPFIVGLIGATLAAQFLPSNWAVWTGALLRRAPWPVIGAVLGLGILVIEAMAPEGVAPFIYFQF